MKWQHYDGRFVRQRESRRRRSVLAADGKDVNRTADVFKFDLAAIIESVKKTNRCVVVEEAWPVASLASYVASEIMTEAFDYLDAPVIKVTGKDVPMPYAANLEKLALPTVAEVVQAAKAVCYR